jgi:hypothetical protein
LPGTSNSATDDNEVATEWTEYQMAKSVVPM